MPGRGENNCQACHQVYGFGGFHGPDLTNRVSEDTEYEEIVHVVLFGRGRMPAFELPEEDLEALFAWLQWLDGSGRSQPRPLQARNPVFGGTHFELLLEAWCEARESQLPEDVQSGLVIWTTMSCGICHRPFAEGDYREPDLSASAVDLSFEALSDILDRGSGRMPATPLADPEKRSLQAFLEWVAQHRGELVKIDVELTDHSPFALSEVPWFEYE
ncbi:MAG: cytochrome c [Planctomycetota bacterium]|nr:cytochrome c [Planctomycetota bacterium]